jgi:hypothetical protein
VEADYAVPVKNYDGKSRYAGANKRTISGNPDGENISVKLCILLLFSWSDMKNRELVWRVYSTESMVPGMDTPCAV